MDCDTRSMSVLVARHTHGPQGKKDDVVEMKDVAEIRYADLMLHLYISQHVYPSTLRTIDTSFSPHGMRDCRDVSIPHLGIPSLRYTRCGTHPSTRMYHDM